MNGLLSIEAIRLQLDKDQMVRGGFWRGSYDLSNAEGYKINEFFIRRNQSLVSLRELHEELNKDL